MRMTGEPVFPSRNALATFSVARRVCPLLSALSPAAWIAGPFL